VKIKTPVGFRNVETKLFYSNRDCNKCNMTW